MVHRDLKPSNLILSPTGPRLIDMGIARALDETSLTRTGMVVGSPGWISPEEYRGDEVGPAADVYGWALLVLYAATGRPPFGAGRPEVLAARVLNEVPEVTGVPAPLDELVRRALAKEPDRRPGLADIQEGCRRAWRESEEEAEDVTRFLERTWVMPVTDEPQWQVPAARRSRRLMVLALAVVLGAGALGGAVLAGLGRPSGAATPEAKSQTRTTAPPSPSPTAATSSPTAAENATPSAGRTSSPKNDVTEAARVAQSALGPKYLLPAGWTATNTEGASGGATCARPADSPDCDRRGVLIMYGVDVGREYDLDYPHNIGGTYCPETRGAFVQERELRKNNLGYAYEYRKYRVTCSDDREFTAYTAYFDLFHRLIIGRRVDEADMNLIVGSFGME